MTDNPDKDTAKETPLEFQGDSTFHSEAKYQLIFDNALEGIMIMQEDRIKLANPMLLELTGYTLDELQSRSVTEFVHPEDREVVQDRIRRRLKGDDVTPVYSFRLITKAYEIKWIYIKVSRVEWEGKLATLSFLSDITEQKLLEEKLIRYSQVDTLTGIPNRRVFNEKIENEWRRSARDQTYLSILMIDIDHFKAYNDCFGHLAGDDCLKLVAEFLETIIRRPSDLIARYGGEEFIVILQDTDPDKSCAIAENMRQKIESLKIKNAHPSVDSVITISIGVSSVIPDNKFDYKDLLIASDRALYQAKRGGRNQVCSSNINDKNTPEEDQAAYTERDY